MGEQKTVYRIIIKTNDRGDSIVSSMMTQFEIITWGEGGCCLLDCQTYLVLHIFTLCLRTFMNIINLLDNQHSTA